MLEKCSGCGTRILAGGVKSQGGTWCSEQCLQKSVCRTVDNAVPADVMQSAVMATFNGNCPRCGGPGPIDVYSATKLTGMLLMFTIAHPQHVGCASCGRMHRLKAAGHNLLAGWWGPRCFIANLFVLPWQLISAALIRQPTEPSPALVHLVKLDIASRAASLQADQSSA